MKDITIFRHAPCDDCAFYEGDSSECMISKISGFNNEFERDDQPCNCCLYWYDVYTVFEWFFETQKDMIDYV